ncbi:MAG: ATP-binding protein [Treponema sp.]|nr:ATP-binding protein [Treponema sp.]
MRELTVKALDENLETVQAFVRENIEKLCEEKNVSVDPKVFFQIDLAVEEIFVNIAHYAYSPETGEARVLCEAREDPLSMSITFLDAGRKFNPLENEEPDTALSAEARDIGGLGIFLTKKYMDTVEYRYADKKNILVLTKKL